MYCPNCATQITGTKFCRTCGANVSQVSQALTGQLPAQGLSKAEKPPSIERAAGSFFSGLAFILVSFSVLFFAPAGRIWWFWMLIPAFGMIGKGVGEYWKLREQQRQMELMMRYQQLTANQPAPPAMQPGAAPGEIGAPDTNELRVPSSITEETTRHLK
jgi:hypothetical protein